jgi:hypothetical protein
MKRKQNKPTTRLVAPKLTPKPGTKSAFQEIVSKGGIITDADYPKAINAMIQDRWNGHMDHELGSDMLAQVKELRVFGQFRYNVLRHASKHQTPATAGKEVGAPSYLIGPSE